MSSCTNPLPFDEAAFLSRRTFLRAAAAIGVSGAALASLRSPGSRSAWAADPLKGQIDAALADFVASGFPGVAVQVEQAGKTVYKGAAGLASVEQEIPLKVGDRHRMYSIAKAFTAIVALQLVEEGVLSLDDTVTKWLDEPEVARIPNTDQSTLRQILNHTSGIYDFADDNDSSFSTTRSWRRKRTGRRSGRCRNSSPTPTEPSTRRTSPPARAGSTPIPTTS